MTDLLRREIALKCTPERAFEAFTEQVDLWWPRSHRKSREGELRLEPEAGGRLVERGTDGSEWAMASVKAFDPPVRLELDWFPGSPAAPTSVVVTFTANQAETIVTIIHRPLTEGSAAIWPERVALFEKGWSAVLPALQTFIDTEPTGD